MDFESTFPGDIHLAFFSNLETFDHGCEFRLVPVVAFGLCILKFTGAMVRWQSLAEEGKARYDNKVNFKVVDLVSEPRLVSAIAYRDCHVNCGESAAFEYCGRLAILFWLCSACTWDHLNAWLLVEG